MASTRPDFYLGTAIDGVHLNAEQLNVRSTDLNQLIGSVTYTEALFHILLGRLPNDQERRLLDLVLVSFHGGFGILPPTTLIPRLVAGTGVNTAQAMAAGFLASGPYHVGAAEHAMKLYREIADEFEASGGAASATSGQLEQFAFASAARKLDAGATIGGYGHPLLRKDPRPTHMRRLICDLGVTGFYLDIYDGVVRCMRERKGVPPNVDGMSAAILLHLGFSSQHGTGLFLLARSAAMLAHIVEEQTEMPYQTMRRFMFMPVAMPKLFNTDFKKLTRRFNGLRDSKLFQTVRSTLSGKTRRARQESADREQTDQVAIDEYRGRQAAARVADRPAESCGTPHTDAFVEAGRSDAVAFTDEASLDGLAGESDSPELLAGAAFFLATCLDQIQQDGADSKQNPRHQELIAAALELVEQAGRAAAGTEARQDS